MRGRCTRLAEGKQTLALFLVSPARYGFHPLVCVKPVPYAPSVSAEKGLGEIKGTNPVLPFLVLGDSFPKGPKIEKINLDRKCQSRSKSSILTFRILHKIRVWQVARLKFSNLA